MDVAELVAVLGLSIDEADWERGNELIEKTRKNVEGLSKTKSAAHKKEEEEGLEFTEILEKGLETFVGYEGIKSLGEMVEHTIEATISAKHLGERLGITTQAVQSLGYAADVTGLSQAVLQSGLQRLSYGLQQVSIRGQGAGEAVEKLGLSADSLKKLPLDEQLGKIADGFAKVKDGSERNALAMQIFGRTAGPQMVPLLLEGSAGINDLREEAERLGVTMSEEGVEQTEKFERAQKQLQARIGAVKDKIVMALLPALEVLVKGFSRVFDFVTTNQEVLIGAISAIGAAIVYAGQAAVLAWAPILIPFAAFVAAVGIVVTVVVKLQTYLSGVSKVILGIALVISLWFAPLTAAVALIALIATNWDAVVDGVEAVGEAVQQFWEDFKDWAQGAGEYISNLPVIRHLLAIIKGADNLIHNSPSGKGGGGGGTSAGGWANDVLTMIPGVGLGEQAFSAATGNGFDWARAIPGGGLTKDVIHIQSSITVHTGADGEKVLDAIQKHHEDTIRQAYHNVKKGG